MKTVELDSPWWGAAKKFGWEHKSPGLGVAESIVQTAAENGEDIQIVVGEDGKYGTYRINGVEAERITRQYTHMAKTVRLRIIPQSACNGAKP